jgi:phosphatidylglycerophosphate synthase
MKAEVKTLVFVRGRWVLEERAAAAGPATTLPDLWRFHGNVIGYIRVAMLLVAGWTVTGPRPFTTAGLLLGSLLLDWIDGPVARKFDQCTIFGSGVDWMADMLNQVLTLVWWARLSVWVVPFLLAFTAVEMALSLFDFAMTATGRYPTFRGKLAEKYNGFFAVIDWSLPDGSYNRLGDFLWLAYPFFSVCCCLRLAQAAYGPALDAAQAVLAIPALLYIWYETAYLCFMLRNWREPART